MPIYERQFARYDVSKMPTVHSKMHLYSNDVEVAIMKPNKMKVAVVQAAVKKGIKDIKDEPKRGIRNLVEMGEMFATGRFQQDFFAMAINQLHDESSAYYRIVERVVKTTNEDTIATFGMNFGYNALTHGAAIIRGIEQSEGFNVPWCLMIELAADNIFPSVNIEGVIEQGKELGIYCYFLYIDAGYPWLEKLLDTLQARRDCAFIAFLHPTMITDAVCQSFSELHNTLPVLDMDGVSDEEMRSAIDGLSRVRSPFGGFSRRGVTKAADISPQILQRAEALELPGVVFIRTKKHRPQNEDDVYNQMIELRNNLDVPVLPIDLYGDLAHVDRIISTEACLAAIKRDGSFVLTNVDENVIVGGKNIHNTSLRQILKDAMPKHIYPQ